MCQVKIGCTPGIRKEIFEIGTWNYDFHHFLTKLCNIRSVYYGTATAFFIGRKIRDKLANSRKDYVKKYIQPVGFFQQYVSKPPAKIT